MKTPDETKKGLECCKFHYGDMYTDCSHCPYYLTSAQCDLDMHDDALALIQQLQAENAEKDARIKQLEAERDALMEHAQGRCVTCKHVDKAVTDDPCSECVCKNKTLWEWRGVQKEG